MYSPISLVPTNFSSLEQVAIPQFWTEIFKDLKSEPYGEITHIPFPNTSQLPDDDKIDVYVYQWVPGLILVLTSSKEKDYEKTLKQFIKSKRGITESWIKPSVFQEMKNFLVKKYDAEIYRFISRRYRHWISHAAKIRPEYDVPLRVIL